MAAPRRESRAPDALGDYRRKRDFERTAEPRGGEVSRSGSGRVFVVQKHEARRLHYDLRLELDGVLKSWAVPKGPSLDPAQKPLAVEVEDHPMEYASFEGVIPRGQYGAGTVMVWDAGEWEPIGDPHEGYGKGDLKFRLHGRKLRGEWVLARLKPKPGESARNWLLIKKADAEARRVESFNVLAELPCSVSSGRTMAQIARDPEAVWTEQGAVAGPAGAKASGAERRGATGAVRAVPEASSLTGARPRAMPASFAPQLATPVDAPPEGDEWLHEVKLDGYRLIARVEGGRARLLTRNGHDWTDRMETVAAAAARLPVSGAILDGEVVVLDAAGISDFQALQNAFRGGGKRGLVYFVFDVPWADGYDLSAAPLRERKAYLEALLHAAPLAAPALRYSEHFVGKGPIVLAEAARAGLEGIVSKRVDSPYEQRRTETWRKVKCTLREEFVVGGYTDPAGSRAGFGALLLGQYDEAGRLVYCGRVGTGFDERSLRELAAELGRRVRAEAPFHDGSLEPAVRSAHWVEPELVAEVEFNGWTDEGFVRQAAWRGVREDKPPRVVVRRRRGGGRPAARPAAGAGAPGAARAGAVVRAGAIVDAPASPRDAFVGGVRISHPERTVYPEDGVTKKEVAEYYAAVAPWMLPHVAGRPLSLVRCPLGLAGEAFYQRQPGEGFPASIRGIAIGDDTALVIDGREGLIALAQMGALEIHAWGCREDDPERPDRLVFDLDPGPGIEWEHVVESARFVRRILEGAGLESFVKTTGGQGLHLVVPLVRRAGWEEAKEFCRAVAGRIVRIAPLNFTATITRARRDHRIFIDYLRNQRGATAVAAYSTRARTGATVSTPLAWEELSAAVAPGSFTVRTVPQRLAALDGDPWRGFREKRQSITAAARKSVGLE